MSIDYIRRKIYEREVVKNRKAMDPQEMHDKMKQDVAAIADSPGFKEIVGFFKREADLHDKRLGEIKDLLVEGKNVDQNYINTVLVSHGLANKFLTFLVNLLSS